MAEGPMFNDQEMISKTWISPRGDVFKLLDRTEIDFNLRGKLLVFKYGDPNTGFVTCLDFYRASTNSMGEKKFTLIKHDFKSEMIVTSIKPAESQNRAAIFVTRETNPGTAKQRQGMRYAWRYEGDYSMRMDFEIGTWTIP